MAAFETLNDLNINGHTEKKNVSGKELTYLSWPWAWAEVKKRYPDAHYTIWKGENGLPYTVDPATGYMVYTSVTIEGITHEMWLPVMDGANKAMKPEAYTYKVKNPNFKYAKWDEQKKAYLDRYGKEQPEYLVKAVESASMMDINKAVMRCLVKNLAMFGLGLYIYAGEDLPESEKEDAPDNNDNLPPPESDSKPFNRPEEPAKAEVQQAPINPVFAYIANERTYMAQLLGISKDEMKIRFGAFRKSLIDGKVIEDIPADKLTMEQAKALVDAIYKNFFSDKKGDKK